MLRAGKKAAKHATETQVNWLTGKVTAMYRLWRPTALETTE